MSWTTSVSVTKSHALHNMLKIDVTLMILLIVTCVLIIVTNVHYVITVLQGRGGAKCSEAAKSVPSSLQCRHNHRTVWITSQLTLREGEGGGERREKGKEGGRQEGRERERYNSNKARYHIAPLTSKGWVSTFQDFIKFSWILAHKIPYTLKLKKN